MSKKAYIFWGGWNGHTPEDTSAVFERELVKKDFDVRRDNNQDALADLDYLKTLDLIIPVWTMGEIENEKANNLSEAIKGGVGMAGVHGGMCDSFRQNLMYQWMTGGQFLAHPYVGDYEVMLTDRPSPITEGLPKTFRYKSEQYYMQVEPSIMVLAETIYDHDDQKIAMPVIWTKRWGKGKVFFSALGHTAEEFTTYPQVLAMTIRGFLWACEQ